ncbi:MAG: hypothetical protein IKW10_01525 [Oscillospiraceae bacterium]|nr:hypothetical protein [Oscillospiraceae bacterium]
MEVIGILLVALIVQGIFAAIFANFADQKGHSFALYFLACFFFSLIGYLMVAALPDSPHYVPPLRTDFIVKNNPQSPYPTNNGCTASPVVQSAPASNWTCTCGRINPGNKNSCACGVLRCNIYPNK